MAKDTIGHVTCPHCGGQADVREDKKKKLYYLCGGVNWAKGCGKFAPSTGPGQEWLRRNMRPLDAPPPAPAPVAEDIPPPAPPAPAVTDTAPPPAPQKRPWWAQDVQG